MPSNSKEKYSQLYIEAKELSEKTSLLKKRSRLLLVFQIISMLLLLIFMLTFVPYYQKAVTDKDVLLLYYTIVFFFFALIYYWMRIMQKKTKRLYLSVQGKCGDLSDMVDWTSMRKRQLYHQLDEKIQEPIDAFYDYSISLLCPYYGGKKLFLMLQLLFHVEMIAYAALSLILTYKGVR